MIWTPEQEKAIYTPTGKGNILVSAAAGSGKTAVLVERIIQKLLNGGSIDRLLVVTFTNAAAAEMREKIIKSLVKELENAENDKETAQHLKKQVHLAESADIMTIDAFCIRVVQNNFHVLGIDADMSITDEAMAELIKQEALESLMTRLYKTTDSEEKAHFSRLIDGYASNRDDRGLEQVITTLHDFIMSFAEPEKWLDNAVNSYSLPILKTPYAKYLSDISTQAAKSCIESARELIFGLDVSNNDTVEENSRVYLINYANELIAVAEEYLTAVDWNGIYAVYKKYFRNLSRKKNFPYTVQKPPETETKEYKDALDRLKYIRAIFLDRVNSGVTTDIKGLSDIWGNTENLREEAEDIVWIEKLFIEEYTKAKDKRGVREFSDIEHMTFDLFSRHEDIRANYREKYDEILIDEYQDTNGLQDSIFELISKKNIFMVGDLKQSIYRFRGGDPYIFKEKSRLYSEDGTGDVKITLAQNFRSRQEVLRSVNDIFSCVMSNEAGDVDYRGDELIVRDKKRDYYPAPATDCKSELHHLLLPSDTDSAARHAEEIHFTVNKIKSLLDSGVEVYDTDTGSLRPIRKKDIVILVNSTKTNGDTLVRELGRLGVDAYCDTKSFFDRREIKVIMSLISVINNSRQDIPLLAVMRSPIGGFTDDELVRIRLCAGRTENYITAVRVYARESDPLARKCAAFIDSINRWRGYVRRMPVAKLLWTLYEETYFYDMMGAIEHGEEAQFNLRLLYERAKQYENAGFKGLFRFIEYIEHIEDSDKDLGGAKMISENHDVVRIMTIHKSKGLEFPYVFLLNAGGKLKTSEGIKSVKTHKDLLLGLRDIHYDEHYTRDTALYELIDRVNTAENKAERMRVLYVALTRAREKLYVIATDKESSDSDDSVLISSHADKLISGKMLPKDSLKINTFAGWVSPAAFTCSESWNYTIHHIVPDSAEDDEHAEDSEDFSDSAELKQAVYDILDYQYPFTESNIIPSRTSVTQIKELAIERESIYDTPVYEPDSRRSSGADDMAELMFSPLHQKPAFMREKGDKPANEIGTLYHLVMSEISLERVKAEGPECIKPEIDRLAAENIISDEDLKYIDTDKIKKFYDCPIGKRVLASGEVVREAPFQINIPASLYDPALADKYDNETVILQGIIDCFFKEGNGYILLDYKTDKIRNNSAQIRAKYAKQLELYKKAIEKLKGTPVTEAYLYLFDAGEIV
ncbi:MAG: helicase-exonuclease AddAB subunit AddA [Oscillospiraceae bacterium]|nr:helicase-exonuclease AddAB subunit AddA [Oscillospiraceae bacterium]